MITTPRHVRLAPRSEMIFWKFIRLSGLLLVPLVWIHTILITLVIGSENVNSNFVLARWTHFGWRIFDLLLLTLALSHGSVGFRQILLDFGSGHVTRSIVGVAVVAYWCILIVLGAYAIFAGGTQ